MTFTIDPPPVHDDTEVLRQWVVDQLERLEGDLARFRAATKYAEPKNPQNGDIVYADGTSWNPGSGLGFYGYENGSWVKL